MGKGIKAGKKSKKPAAKRQLPTTFDVVRTTNYLNLAVMVRTLYMVNGWRTKRLGDFLESYIALMEEIADKRSSVVEFVKDTKELTGIDVVEWLEDIYR